MTDLSALPWRQGRGDGRDVYAQPGPRPANDDPPVGVLATAELAREVVAAHNERLARANFGTISGDGRLEDYEGHDLWHMSVYLPEGREGEVAGWMAVHGLEVYRMQKVEDIAARRTG